MNNTAHLIPRRSDYESIGGEQEYFVIPLLRGAIYDALAKYAATPRAGAQALDIGAGECPLKNKIENLGFHYVSLDIAQNRTNTIDHVARIDGSLPEKLLDGAGFDLVLCTEVLEHVPDWTTAFVNLSKLLRPGGICIITTPFFYMPHEEPYDYWRATDHALEYFAQKCDLKIVQSLRTGSGWDVIGTLLCSTSVCRRQKSILGMMATIPVYLAHRLAIRFFKIRKLSNLVEMQTRFFVGNALVLQK